MPTFAKTIDLDELTVALGDFYWTPISKWTPEQVDFFSSKAAYIKKNRLFANGKSLRASKQIGLNSHHQWILTSSEQDCEYKAFGYLQIHQRNRTKLGFLMIEFEANSIQEGGDIDQFCVLISLIFRVAKLDVLHVSCYANLGSKILNLDPQFSSVQVLVPSRPNWLSPLDQLGLERQALIRIHSPDWLNFEQKAQLTRHLKHIIHRLERDEKSNANRSKTKRNFFVRLFNPKVDDPLF